MNARPAARRPRPRVVNRPKVKALYNKTERERNKLAKERAVIQKQLDKLNAKADVLDTKISTKNRELVELEEIYRLSESFTKSRRRGGDEDED